MAILEVLVILAALSSATTTATNHYHHNHSNHDTNTNNNHHNNNYNHINQNDNNPSDHHHHNNNNDNPKSHTDSILNHNERRQDKLRDYEELKKRRGEITRNTQLDLSERKIRPQAENSARLRNSEGETIEKHEGDEQNSYLSYQARVKLNPENNKLNPENNKLNPENNKLNPENNKSGGKSEAIYLHREKQNQMSDKNEGVLQDQVEQYPEENEVSVTSGGETIRGGRGGVTKGGETTIYARGGVTSGGETARGGETSGGETIRGGIRRKRSVVDEVERVCQCVREAQTPGCEDKREDYGPIVIRGECYNGGGRRGRNHNQTAEEEAEPQTSSISDGSDCQGTKPLILLSSGPKLFLNLTGIPEVLVCSSSLWPYLQQLTITDVPRIRIGRAILQPRMPTPNFVLLVIGDESGGRLVVPEDGLKVDTGEIREYGRELSGADIVEAEEATVPPVQVSLEVRNMTEVRLEGRSVVAPRLALTFSGITKVTLESNAIIPFANPELSQFELSNVDTAIFKTESVTIGNVHITKVKKLEMHNGAVEIFKFSPFSSGGRVHVEDVQDFLLDEKALTYHSSGSLTMLSVIVGRASRRSITTKVFPPLYLPIPLSNITFNQVVFENFEPVALCLSAKYASLTDLLVMRGHLGSQGDVNKAVCVSATKDLRASTQRNVAPDSPVASAAVVCAGQQPTPNICPDPLCQLCQPQQLSVVPTIPTVPGESTLITPRESPLPVPVTDGTGNHSNHTTTTNTIITFTDIDPPYGDDINEIQHSSPILLPLLVVGALLALLVLLYCLYRIRKRGKRAEYKLPRTAAARCTFPNTIVTRDTLDYRAASTKPSSTTNNTNTTTTPSSTLKNKPDTSEVYVGFSTTVNDTSDKTTVTSDNAYMAAKRRCSSVRETDPLNDEVPVREAEEYSMSEDIISKLLQDQSQREDVELQYNHSSLHSSQDLPPYGYVEPVAF